MYCLIITNPIKELTSINTYINMFHFWKKPPFLKKNQEKFIYH